MPLLHSKSPGAFKQNVSTLMHEVGKSPHVQSRAQALAIAYDVKRRGKAGGGGLGERLVTRDVTQGFLHSAVPGRTDKLPISVKGGAYVLPADHVAAVGQGNSIAGAAIISKMFKMGPYGSSPMGLRGMRAQGPHLSLKPTAMRARGGHSHHVQIVAAGGEIVIPPEKIIEHFGDLDEGHKALDKWVVRTRKKHVKTLRKLKPPKQD